ncbi:MAG: DUF4342 domain-containing protein [Pseudomonadota bacterium]
MHKRSGPENSAKTFTEEFEISAEKLIERIKELAAEANTRRVRIRAPHGDIAVDIPLSVGAVAGGAFVVAAPALALIGSLVAFFSKVTLEVVREAPSETDTPDQTTEESA